ncbi:hypothetical protein [Sinosporangium siamense]|uniref:Toxin-antitoxin system HicB family antitoxin n=1 Tax=Sinosporangium siamense TaxID=1367973 RepID=A0A919RL88_9ACTN|nr:hypothetical protein [Sinosporangium siamense]GII93999.1 hypothetical protein Ssi02_42300 [Sinosporangium siamense]
MKLAPYVDQLRRELAAAAEAGGEEMRAAAERLASAMEAAARLALLESLSAAADEITRELAPGSVAVRLRGRDPDFVVVTPPAAHTTPAERAAPAPPPPPPAPEGDEGATARISLRIPEHLKPRIEDAARAEGLSVNSWLVRAVTAALDTGGTGHRRGTQSSGRSYTGWVR